MDDIVLGVSEAVDLINLALEQASPLILIEGEVSSFKVNQNKFIFFDIKDESSTLGCFMMLFQLKYPIQDGMRIRVLAQPKLTKWGKFSLTIKEVVPVGEGSLKKSFDLLKKKLEAEGLFDESRKRPIPRIPQRIGIVSSSGAAGYKDFLKILDNRWGGLQVILADVNVQGADSPAQIVSALNHLNELSEPVDVIAVIRGGGSSDDLAAFNHEDVVRAVAVSRTPTIVGVGHEVDTSLADLASDVRAATPSNAAELLVPDKNNILEQNSKTLRSIHELVNDLIKSLTEDSNNLFSSIEESIDLLFKSKQTELASIVRTLAQLDPALALRRGYSIVRSDDSKIVRSIAGVTIKDSLKLEVTDGTILTEVVDVYK
jgi:exodeoxyribonuclease VII large subunit